MAQGLMRNSFLKFDNILFREGIEVKNITLLPKLRRLSEKFSSENYIKLMRLEDNKLLEAISYELYEDTNYWDLLLLLNNMDSMFSLPVDFDLLHSKGEKELEKWVLFASTLNYNITSEVKSKKFGEIMKVLVEKNEKHRIFKYVSISDLSLVLSDLNTSKYEPINKKLIINLESE